MLHEGAGLVCTGTAETLGPTVGFAQRIIVPLGVVKVCASARDRRRGLPTHSGRQAASPSPNPVLNTGPGGRAWFEWCTAREAPRRPQPNAASQAILGRRLRAPSAVGRVRFAASWSFGLTMLLIALVVVPLFVPLSFKERYSRAATLPLSTYPAFNHSGSLQQHREHSGGARRLDSQLRTCRCTM